MLCSEGSEDEAECRPLSVAVLSCGPIGFDVANRIAALPAIGAVSLITTPYRTKRRRFLEKIKWAWRMEGPPGMAAAAGRRFRKLARRDLKSGSIPALPELDFRVRHLSFSDFHDPACLEALKEADPDLGVVAGTYILRECVYRIPRMGTINLHSGRVPEYRGAAPAFWELYHGESEVGITIHEVERDVDAGMVFRHEVFPLDPAPAGDPLEYVERFRLEVLAPNGVRMLAQTVEEIAAGEANPWSQDSSRARTFYSPDYRAKCELRRRVERRRKEAAPGD